MTRLHEPPKAQARPTIITIARRTSLASGALNSSRTASHARKSNYEENFEHIERQDICAVALGRVLT